MRRLLFACLAVFIAVGAARGQDAGRVYRLGLLVLNPRSVEQVRTLTLPELARRGFVEGQNVIIDTRIGEAEQLPALVRTGLEAERGFRSLLRGYRSLGAGLGSPNVS